MIRNYAEIFCWKNVSSFAVQKLLTFFSAKNIKILYIESTKTVNEMTLNELVKLTTLWTTGPWHLKKRTHSYTWSSEMMTSSYTALSLRKHTYFKYTKNFTSKNWKFSDKNYDIFHVSAQNIDCGYSLEPPRRGGSNEYPQSMCLSRNKKNNVYPCKPQCYYIKVGF